MKVFRTVATTAWNTPVAVSVNGSWRSDKS